ncbi:hypothetical protein [Bosea sp. TAF32]|uniref:hypothetical protein n=1 Tax=Bosea sp. TAF32 TaxID=3237482 RepID=UPI003F9054A7
MHSGNGTLILSSGHRLRVVYNFGTDHDDARAGYLLCNTSGVDPVALHDRMHMLCDDGTKVVMMVTRTSDRYLLITGRVAPPAAA